LKFSAAPETHFMSILMLAGRGKFNICGLDHFASEPFNYATLVPFAHFSIIELN